MFLVKRDILIKNFSNLEYEKSHLRKVTSDCFAHEALTLNFVDQSSREAWYNIKPIAIKVNASSKAYNSLKRT